MFEKNSPVISFLASSKVGDVYKMPALGYHEARSFRANLKYYAEKHHVKIKTKTIMGELNLTRIA